MLVVFASTLTFALACYSAFLNADLHLALFEQGEITHSVILNVSMVLLTLITVLFALVNTRRKVELKAEDVVHDDSSQNELQNKLDIAAAKISELERRLALPPKSEYLDATVLNFVSLLQEKGRLVDFAMEDISQHPDDKVGMVARIVHQGVNDVFNKCFAISPLQEAKEGESIALEKENSTNYKFIGGNDFKAGQNAIVLHRGWKANTVNISRITEAGQDLDLRKVICPTEIKIS